jgi:hypothetical protein
MAFVAVHQDSEPHRVSTGTDDPAAPDQRATAVLPWSPDDGRIAASHGRGPAVGNGGVSAAYEQIVVEGISDAAGPITFLRPTR